MDTQFAKWSYDHHEGVTAIPFVMAQAPAETHARLIEVDRTIWTAGIADDAIESADSRDIASVVLERVQRSSVTRTTSSQEREAATVNISSKTISPRKGQPTSKRAALIAKSKAANDNLLVSSKSVGQKQSTLHKNKHRRSIMSSPQPTTKRFEPVRKPDAQSEQSKPTIFMLNEQDNVQRHDVDAALQNRNLDFDNTQQLQELMSKLGKAITEKSEAEDSRVAEDVSVTLSTEL